MNSLVSKIKCKYNSIPLPAKASLWFMICSVIQKGISLITIPIFTRIMSTEQFGQYNTFVSWYNIIVVFTSLSLYYGVYNNAMIKYESRRDEYTSSMQGLTITITLCFFCIYLLFRNDFNNMLKMNTTLVVLLFAKLLVSPSIEFYLVRNRFEFKYKNVVILTLSQALIGSVVGVVAVLSTYDKAFSRIASLVFIDFVFSFAVLLFQFHKGRVFFNKEYWKYAIVFNLPLIPHYLSGIVLSQGDRVMISHYVGDSAVAMYSVAYNIAILINIVIQAINASLTPWMYEKLRRKEVYSINRMTNMLSVCMLAVITMLILFAPEVLNIIATEEYREAVYVIPPVAVSTFFTFLYNIFANTEFFYEERRFVSIGSIAAALVNIGLNAIFIPAYGYIAAAYTTLVCYIIYGFSHLFFSQKVVNIHVSHSNVFDTKFIFVLAIISILLTVFSFGLYNASITRYILIILMIIAVIIKRETIVVLIKTIRNKE